MRIADATDVLLAILEQAGLGHDIDAAVLSGDQFGAAGADAVLEAEIRTALGDPHRPIGAIGHIRHSVLQFARRVLDEQRRRHPRHIEVAVGGDPIIAHVIPSHGVDPIGESFRLYARTGKPPVSAAVAVGGIRRVIRLRVIRRRIIRRRWVIVRWRRCIHRRRDANEDAVAPATATAVPAPTAAAVPTATMPASTATMPISVGGRRGDGEQTREYNRGGWDFTEGSKHGGQLHWRYG